MSIYFVLVCKYYIYIYVCSACVHIYVYRCVCIHIYTHYSVHTHLSAYIASTNGMNMNGSICFNGNINYLSTHQAKEKIWDDKTFWPRSLPLARRQGASKENTTTGIVRVALCLLCIVICQFLFHQRWQWHWCWWNNPDSASGAHPFF